MTKFNKLTEEARSMFKSKKVDPEDMKTYFATMGSIQNSSKREMIDALFRYSNSVDAMFNAVEYYGLWNYINYSLFDDMVAEFLESQPQNSLLKAERKAYEVMLEESVLSMCLEHACQNMELPFQAVHANMEKYFTRWTFTVEVQNYKLKFVDNLRHSLAVEFEVPTTLILLLNLELTNNVLTITWLVPNSFQTQVNSARIQSCLQWFENIGILTMKIGETLYYKVTTLMRDFIPSSQFCRGKNNKWE